jgi:hypothetical protein
VCAFVLVTHVAAATRGSRPVENGKAKPVHAARTAEAQLELLLTVARRERRVLRFFESHPRPASSPKHGQEARARVRRARAVLAVKEREIAHLRRVLHTREIRRLRALPPQAAICDVFDRYCGQAVQVAWCESRLHTDAENGQYLGLFQMGSSARGLYGHGPTAHEQAVAAHRYFVSSGRDWSPWSCKPWRV